MSANCQPTLSPYGKPIIKIRWSRDDCGNCKVHEALHEQKLGLIPIQSILTVLLEGCDELYEEEARDDDALDDLDDEAWEERLRRPDSASLGLQMACGLLLRGATVVRT